MTQPVAASPGFTLHASTDKSTYDVGERIKLKLQLEYTGTGEVQLHNPRHVNKYRIEVRLPHRTGENAGIVRLAPLTVFGESTGFVHERGGSSYALGMQAGKPVVVEIPWLNRLYDMTADGKYMIIAHRSVPSRDNPNNFVDVESQPIWVTVEDIR